jgi:penicillin-binding protein 2
MSLYLSSSRYFERSFRRIKVLYFAGLFALFVILIRLWYLQIVRYPFFVRQAEAQVIRVLPLYPPRGEILARGGERIATYYPGLRLRLYPERLTSPSKTLKFLESILRHPPQDLEELLKKARRIKPYRPWTVVEHLDRDELARFYARASIHPELGVEAVPLRRYPWGVLGSHLLGHLGEIDEQEIERWKGYRNYQPGDLVGKFGIEASYEPWLFGQRGREEVKVDALGRVRETVRRIPPVSGWDLVLTIDLPAQRAAESALGGRRGAIVALDPRNGEILALVSHPNFDPELFLEPVSNGAWEQVLKDPDRPFLFRALAGQYPPGSTIKPIVAVAGLMEGAIKPSEKIHCPGYYRLGSKVFRCWRKEGHGVVDLHRAIVESCDVLFYEVGRRLGIDRLKRYAQLFGLGKKTGVDLPGEKAGIFPDSTWKLEILREPWQPGESAISAIGQGYVLVTPLQLAVAYAVFANGGYRVKPHLFYNFLNTDRPAPPFTPPEFPTEPVNIPREILARVSQALIGVVNEPGGTGGYARIRGISVAGKTGTAQVVSLKTGERSEDPLHKDHAWFSAFAPAEDPRIVVVVLVENAGHGGSAAAPLARQVIEAYLSSRFPPHG